MLPRRRMRACRKKACKKELKQKAQVIRPKKRVKQVEHRRKQIQVRKPKKIKKVKKVKKVTKAKTKAKTIPATSRICRRNGYLYTSCRRKTISFDPRGKSAPAFESMGQSKSTTYCKLAARVLMDLGHIMGVSYQLERAINERGKKSLCDVLGTFFPVDCMKGWRITNFLGAGSFGFVFSIRDYNNKRGALKIVRDEANFSVKKEIEMQNKFNDLKLSPDVLDHCSFKPRNGGRVHFIIMERIDGVIDNFLQRKSHRPLLNTLIERLFQIIQTMDRNKFTHGDFHTENIGYVYRRGDNPGRIQIIDHGMSSCTGSTPELEVVQLLRTLDSRYCPKIHPANQKFVQDKVRDLAWKRFKLKPPRSIGGLENRFVQLRRKLYRER